MKFERPELWLFCLLCVGPFLIYRFCRRPERRIDWAAMHFLRHAVQQTRQKTRLLEMAQLLTQTLLTGLVALAVLLPVWDFSKTQTTQSLNQTSDQSNSSSQANPALQPTNGHQASPSDQPGQAGPVDHANPAVSTSQGRSTESVQTSEEPSPTAARLSVLLSEKPQKLGRCVIYVVDDSGSMNAQFLSPQLAVSEPLSRFALLQKAILQELDASTAASPTEAVLLLPALAAPSELLFVGKSSVDRRKAQTFVGQLVPSVAVADWNRTCHELEQIAEVLAPHCETLEIRIFSDFQWGNESEETTNATNAAQTRAIAQSLKRLSGLAWIQVIPIFQQVQNLAITKFVPHQTPVLTGENAELCVTLTNFTSQDVEHQLVELFVLSQDPTQKESVAQQWVKIPAHESLEVVFNYRFADEEPRTMEVELGGGGLISDGFRADDSCRLYVKPKAQAKFLLIESWNEDFSKALVSGCDFLEAALKGIFSQRLDAQTEAVKVERAVDTTLASWNLTDFDGIFINDVCQFEVAEAQGLEDWVKNGGVLFCFTGKKTTEQTELETLPPPLRRLLPGLPRLWKETTEAANAFRLNLRNYENPWLAEFKPFAPTGLETLPAVAYAQCVPQIPEGAQTAQPQGTSPAETPPQTQAASSTKADTVLAFTNGDPWILTWRYGSGTVVQFTYPADTQQNTFPLSPMFIPLLERLMGHATERSAAQNPASDVPCVDPREYALEQPPLLFNHWQEIFAPNVALQRENLFQILDGSAAGQRSLVPRLLLWAVGLLLLEGLLQYLRTRRVVPRQSQTEVPR